VNFVLSQFASGNAYFLGLALVAIACLLRPRFRGCAARSAIRVLFLLGVAGIACSGTPLPLWSYAILAALSLTYFLWLSSSNSAFWKRARTLSQFAFFGALATAVAAEAIHRIPPKIAVSTSQPVYVIGDSLSAGIGANERLWPALLAESTGLNVVNLAKAGATTAEAMYQAREITDPHALVLIEIGGNDILGEAKVEDFRSALDALVTKLTMDGDTVVLFELPLLPFGNHYGMAQRTVANRHGIPLIPKTCLSNVFAAEGATVDGIHLSPAGHIALAKAVARMIVVDGVSKPAR